MPTIFCAPKLKHKKTKILDPLKVDFLPPNLKAWLRVISQNDETVIADNGKTRCFILCENKQWLYSNASASTSLKNINQATIMQAAFHTV